MKSIKCVLGFHKWSQWEEVGMHLERKCLRECGNVQVGYLGLYELLAKCCCRIIVSYLEGDINGRRRNKERHREIEEVARYAQ